MHHWFYHAYSYLLVVGEAVAERAREEVHGAGCHGVGDSAVAHAVSAVAVGDVIGIIALRKVVVRGHDVHRVHVRVVAEHCRTKEVPASQTGCTKRRSHPVQNPTKATTHQASRPRRSAFFAATSGS